MLAKKVQIQKKYIVFSCIFCLNYISGKSEDKITETNAIFILSSGMTVITRDSSVYSIKSCHRQFNFTVIHLIDINVFVLKSTTGSSKIMNFSNAHLYDIR